MSHRRSARNRGSVDRSKPAAGENRRHRHAARQMSDPCIRRAEQFPTHPGSAHKRAHQDEHRHDAEIEIGDGTDRRIDQDTERGIGTNQVGKSGERNRAEANRDRHSHQHQYKYGDATERRDQCLFRHASPSAPLPKFVMHRATLWEELRKQRGTSKHMIPVLGFE